MINYMDYFPLIAMLFYFVMAWIDLKYNEIPSIVLTGFIFVCVALYFNNFYFGLLTFIVAWLFYEGTFFNGIADVKVMGTMGFFVQSYVEFIALILFICIVGLLYKFIFVKVFRYRIDDEVAFIPSLAIAFTCYLATGVGL